MTTEDPLTPVEWAVVAGILRSQRNLLGWSPDSEQYVRELLDKVEAHMVGLEPDA